MKTKLARLLLVSWICLVLFGCGGGGGSSDSASAPSNNWDSLVWDQGNWS